jgi:hypothetical protein
MPQTKVTVEIETHVMLDNFFFNRTVYEVMWKNMVQPDRPHI